MAGFLAIRAGKDCYGSPLYGGMFISLLTQSFGILQKREATMLTIESSKSFSPILYKHINSVIDNGFGNYSFPNDTPRNQLGRQVRQRAADTNDDEPPVIPAEDELPMDSYNVAF
ncbi:unnamed protein product [Lactuca saligna]|uniref:Uncharacterized protein n=1 Tax=Lactuca saligna TaxID=75948 RepID=A0AA35YM29_LACSI|nr:unnamed protein product [Lactuca saligna]